MNPVLMACVNYESVRIFPKADSLTEYVFKNEICMARLFGISISRGVVCVSETKIEIFQKPFQAWSQVWERPGSFEVQGKEFFELVTGVRESIRYKVVGGGFSVPSSSSGETVNVGGDVAASIGGVGVGGDGANEPGSPSGQHAGGTGAGIGDETQHRLLNLLPNGTTREVEVIVCLVSDKPSFPCMKVCIDDFKIYATIVYNFKQVYGQDHPSLALDLEIEFATHGILREVRLSESEMSKVRQGTLHDHLEVTYGPDNHNGATARNMELKNSLITTEELTNHNISYLGASRFMSTRRYRPVEGSIGVVGTHIPRLYDLDKMEDFGKPDTEIGSFGQAVNVNFSANYDFFLDGVFRYHFNSSRKLFEVEITGQKRLKGLAKLLDKLKKKKQPTVVIEAKQNYKEAINVNHNFSWEFYARKKLRLRKERAEATEGIIFF